jgi:uncharacterized delta-60 repeat protein
MKKTLTTALYLFLACTLLSAQVPDSTFGVPDSWLDGTAYYGMTIVRAEGSGDRCFAAFHTAEGKIILAGHTAGEDGIDFALARLTADGQYDTTAGPLGRMRIDIGYANDSCIAAARYSEKQLLMGGGAYLPGQQNYVGLLARLDFDGQLDSAFGHNGHIIIDLPAEHEMITKIITLPDGKILIAGNAFYGGLGWYEPDSTAHFIGRLLPDGRIDSAFAENGFLYRSPVDHGGCKAPMMGDLALAPDGSIVAVANSYDPYPGELAAEFYYCVRNTVFVYRYTADGLPASSFGSDGVAELPLTSGVANSIQVEADGKIIVGGGMSGYHRMPVTVFMTRLLPDGQRDPGFAQGEYFNIYPLGSTDVITSIRQPLKISDNYYLPWRDPASESLALVFGLLRIDEAGRIDSNFVQSQFVAAHGDGVLFSSYTWLPFFFGTIEQAYALDSASVYFVGTARTLFIDNKDNMFIAKAKLLPPLPVSTVKVPQRPNAFTAYPNPVIDRRLHLSAEGWAEEGPLWLRLIDVHGRVVLHQERIRMLDEHVIDVSALTAGIYFLEVSGAAGRWVEKVAVP